MTGTAVTGGATSGDPDAGRASRAEVCIVACAEAWRGDGEILASAIGVIPTIGARLARATFEPDLLLTDGEAMLGQGTWAIGGRPEGIEGWLPYRAIFDLIYNGTRPRVKDPSPVDPHGEVKNPGIGESNPP